MLIREATDGDREAVWDIIRQVIAGGDTYVFAPDTPRDEMLDYWFAPDKYVYVVESDGKILGTMWLKANQPGLGSHVANAAYMVSPDAKGKGVGKAMGEFSLEEARRLGFTAMQFNHVVSANVPAVELYRKLGFAVAGTLPRAFRHQALGLVDVYVMYRFLQPEDEETWK